MLVHRSAVQVSIPGVRAGSPRRSRRLAVLLACVLAATIIVGLGATSATAGRLAGSTLAALDVSTCPGGAQDAGWTLSTTTFDPAFYTPRLRRQRLSRATGAADRDGVPGDGREDRLAAVHPAL
jgi:hypothetical protein